MENLFPIIQVTSAVLLIIAILMQRSSGGGLEGGIGGGSSSVVVKRKRRGFEKFIFEASIGLTIILVVSLILPRILF